MAITFQPLELYQAGFEVARQFTGKGIQFAKTGLHSVAWSGNKGPYEHSVATAADFHEFSATGDIDGAALRKAMKEVLAARQQRGVKPKGELEFHVILIEGTEDRFWVCVYDRYMSDSIQN